VAVRREREAAIAASGLRLRREGGFLIIDPLMTAPSLLPLTVITSCWVEVAPALSVTLTGMVSVSVWP